MKKLLFAFLAWLALAPAYAQTGIGGGNAVPAPSSFALPLFTVATLPACGAATKGLQASVSDATAPTYNAALTGGGAVIVPVYCNGSAWTSH